VRTRFPRGPAQLPHLLSTLKQFRPDHFRQSLRINPPTFDRLVVRLQNDIVFFNSAQNPQIPVEHQVAIALYRFGHSGNAAGLDPVAKWAGYSKGTVHLATQRVLAALTHSTFIEETICLPTEDEKERAKQWVERHSCEA